MNSGHNRCIDCCGSCDDHRTKAHNDDEVGENAVHASFLDVGKGHCNQHSSIGPFCLLLLSCWVSYCVQEVASTDRQENKGAMAQCEHEARIYKQTSRQEG